MKKIINEKRSMIAATIAAIFASICCLGPFILITLGIGTAWVSTLMAFHAIRPYALAIAIACMVLAFWQLYIKPYRTGITPSTKLKKSRLVFWLATLILLGLLAFPWYMGYL